MRMFEFTIKAKPSQSATIDEAIRATQFFQNKCLHLWMDERGVSKYDLNKYSALLAKEFDFANELNSQVRQASATRAWVAISQFDDNCQKSIPGKQGFPNFKKNSRSVVYKTTGG
jgi:putative transposase